MSKQKLIKQHLKQGRSITGLSALRMFGVYRLSSVINRLRNEGMNIITDTEIGANGETYACYHTGAKNANS